METNKTYKKSEEKVSSWRENIEAAVIAIVLALIVRTFVMQAFKIPSGSMLETLQIGDHILVNKLAYGLKFPFFSKTLAGESFPEFGDIIVFAYPEDLDKDFIKRVVGLPGDKIEIRNKKLYRNDKLVEKEPYAVFNDPMVYRNNINPRDNLGPFTVPENMFFTMGDNRDNSHDSRFWGFVDYKLIKGRALMVYWSWDGEALRPRWGRIGRMLR